MSAQFSVVFLKVNFECPPDRLGIPGAGASYLWVRPCVSVGVLGRLTVGQCTKGVKIRFLLTCSVVARRRVLLDGAPGRSQCREPGRAYCGPAISLIIPSSRKKRAGCGVSYQGTFYRRV